MKGSNTARMNRFRCLLCVLALFAAFLAPTPAQELDGQILVAPSLIADSTKIAPGKPFTVGVRLKMAPGWHVYWQHPGESGGPPKIEWELPDGFQAGAIQWPFPRAYLDEGDLLTYILENDLVLPVEITPPAQIPPGEVTLKAKLNWLVCEKICVPGEGAISLTLPTGGDGAPANADLFAKARAQMPKTGDAPFQVAWEPKADALTVTISGLPRDVAAEFFPLPPPGVKPGQPKASTSTAEGKRSITFPLEGAATSAAPWQGVVVTTKESTREGWQVAMAAATLASAPELPPAAAHGLGWALLLAFLGGLILNIMPCVLPVIALKIFGFVKQAGQEPERIFKLGLAFTAGVFAFFLGLAAVVAVLGRAFNWGYQFQNPWLFTALIALVFVFSLNLLGVFEIALSSSATTTMSELSGREGYGGAFLHGMFTTLLGTSCTAPFLAGSLGFATTQPAPIVFLLFAAIASGMSLPYLLLTARPGWLKYLPKPGVWMERAKQIMGFVMLAVVVWLLSTRSADAMAAVSWFLLFVGFACWIYGAFARSALTWLVIAAVIAGGYFFFLADALARPATRSALKSSPDGLPWQTFSEEAVAAAIARGEPVFIDFTADWCVNCKAYEKLVINTEPVKRAFAERKVTLFKADWTDGDPEISKALKRFGRVGVPLYVLHRPGEAKPVVLDALTTGILLGELAAIKN